MQKSLETPFLVTTKIPSFKKFVLKITLLGASLSGLAEFCSFYFLENDNDFFLRRCLETIFYPSSVLGMLLTYPFVYLLGSVAHSFGAAIIIALMFVVVGSTIGGALFFGVLGALIWHGLYRKKVMLAIALCLFVLVYTFSIIFAVTPQHVSEPLSAEEGSTK